MKLWVDDIRTEPEGWVRAKTVTEAIRLLDTLAFDEVSLDHDISHKVSIGMGDPRPFASDENYSAVARYIAARLKPGDLKITLHTANATGAERMAQILRGFDPAISLSKPCNRFEEDSPATALRQAQERIALLERVVEAAYKVDLRCPEGYDGQDSWTNEAHRLLHVALDALKENGK